MSRTFIVQRQYKARVFRLRQSALLDSFGLSGIARYKIRDRGSWAPIPRHGNPSSRLKGNGSVDPMAFNPLLIGAVLLTSETSRPPSICRNTGFNPLLIGAVLLTFVFVGRG